MAAQALVDQYHRWIDEVWGKGDFDVSAELIADDLVDHDAPPGLPPGRAGHDLFCGMIREAFPDLHFTVDVVFADGDLVSGRWTMTGTQTGPLVGFGLEPTGKSVVMSGQEIFRVKDGKFVEMWHQEAVANMLMQLGVIPPPPGPPS